MERVELPAQIERKMKRWRRGEISFPQEYIDFHRDLAIVGMIEVAGMAGVRVVCMEMIPDGWGDDMQVVSLILEKGNKLKRVKWNDSNQGWMERMPSGGWGIFHGF